MAGLVQWLGRWVQKANQQESASSSSRVLLEYRVLGGLIAAAAVVALLAVPSIPKVLWPLGLLFGLGYYLVASRRERRRAQLVAAPFPDAWREVLQQRVGLYQQLDDEERVRFEREVQIFLGEQRIYSLPGLQGLQGVQDSGGFSVTDEHRLLIAASAATLLLGRPEWRLPTVRDIVVYPTAFTEESYAMDGHSHTIGMVHAQGPILFALDALERSYPRPAPRPAPSLPSFFGLTLGAGVQELPTSNVGIHEFAHVVDFIGQGGRATGVPMFIEPAQFERWQQQMTLERERLMSGDSVLHPYGLKNEAEFFAVAVESFFQEPLPLSARHPELYGLLVELFNQDPASRASRSRFVAGYRPLFAMGASPMRFLA